MGTDLSPKYQQLFSQLKADIEQKIWKVDEKLPSIRQMSEQQGVAKNTVIHAYSLLEAAQYIQVSSRSGYRVCYQGSESVQGQIQSPSYVDVTSVLKSLTGRDSDNFDLPAGTAHPDIEFPAIKTLYAEIGRQSRKQVHASSFYQLPPGDPLLINQLQKLCRDMGITSKGSDILITQGAQQAISVALQAVTQPGDIVAVDSPCYFGTLMILESLGLKALEIPSDTQTGMCLTQLETALQAWNVKAIVIHPTFNNPTGATMPLASRKALLALAGDRVIVEDDVFGELYFERQIPTLKSLDKSGKVIFCSSLSKTLDSRLRLGWVMAGEYQQNIEKRLLAENMGSLNLIQSSAALFLQAGHYRKHLAKIRRAYYQRYTSMSALLVKALNADNRVRGQYKISQATGGFTLWLTFPLHLDAMRVFERCYALGVGILPGTVFGTNEQFRHCIRLSYSLYKGGENWERGLQQFAAILGDELEKRLNH